VSRRASAATRPTYRAEGDPQFQSFTSQQAAEQRAKFLDSLDKDERTTQR